MPGPRRGSTLGQVGDGDVAQDTDWQAVQGPRAAPAASPRAAMPAGTPHGHRVRPAQFGGRFDVWGSLHSAYFSDTKVQTGLFAESLQCAASLWWGLPSQPSPGFWPSSPGAEVKFPSQGPMQRPGAPVSTAVRVPGTPWPEAVAADRAHEHVCFPGKGRCCL